MDSPHGLSDAQASSNIEKYGKNVLAEKTSFIYLRELLQSFVSPLTFLLLGASLISAFLGQVTDFIIIFGIVVLSGGVSFFQHFKAERAATKLKSKVQLQATVIRNGVKKEIPFSHVTVDDIVLLSSGDIVPADIQLLEADELSVDESSLTGESFPMSKSTSGNSPKETFAFSGTHVVSGDCLGIVKAIGKNTEIGKLSKKIVEEKPPTDFDREIKSFSLLIIRLILLLALFVFVVNAIFHHSFLTSLLFAVALAVGLTPELMPVIITISLSNGAIKMEKKDVIVKFLPSIQNLGSMNILCMDKTGTITENNITLSSYDDFHGNKDEQILHLAKINSYFQSGFKNPLDAALLSQQDSTEKGEYKKISEIPFDFERKMLSIIVKDSKNKLLMITKGAPTTILQHVVAYQDKGKDKHITEKMRKELERKATSYANKGFRVICLAVKRIEKKEAYSRKDEDNLSFVGFLIFSDPIKSSVKETLKKLTDLGIVAKILTGDNEIVTKKICADAGISITDILIGSQIDGLTDEQLESHVEKVTIFSSLNPEQKARIISALRKKGNVVGFLGDGVNDAPPLKASDVGISVNNGSDIAKDVADIILMKKSLESLSEGVIEGRKAYINTFKYIIMGLSSNFGNMISVAIASVFLPFIPLLPVQILLVNFFYDTSQIAIASDNVDDSAVRKPEKWSLPFLRHFTFLFGPISSIFDLATFSILLLFLHASIPVFRTGWFVESLITQTLIVFAIRTRRVPFLLSVPSFWLVLGAVATIALGAFLLVSSYAHYFSFTLLPNTFWPLLAGEIILYFLCVDLAKLWFYKKYTSIV